MQRVAERVAVFQWDDAELTRYWLIRDYLPEVAELAADRPKLAERARAIGACTQPLLIPLGLLYGRLLHAYRRRPRGIPSGTGAAGYLCLDAGRRT